jgi:hypothetical protein
VYWRDRPNVIVAVFGGSLFSILAVMRGLQSLWREKNVMDMLLVVVPSLSSTEVVKIAKSIYFSRKRG